MNYVIKIGLSILLLLCLADMSYGYYQFVRFISLIGFAILAYQAKEKGQQKEVIIYAILALLFQPFFKGFIRTDTLEHRRRNRGDWTNI